MFQGNREKKLNVCAVATDGRKEGFTMKKYCTRCGKPFEAVGREVICPACKQAAAEETKRAAVLRAKKASWNGESVPVRISGRASTVIREYGAANNMPFAAALDALLQETQFVHGMEEMGVKWDDITPYRSRRRDKTTGTTETTSKPQDVPQASKQAAKRAGKATTSKATSKPQAAGKGGKA